MLILFSLIQPKVVLYVVAPSIRIVAGNVVTAHQAKILIEAGVDGLRVGMGSGSICITQDTLGIGRAQATAIFDVAQYVQQVDPGITIIADGGIRNSGDIFKALACGADAVMMGGMYAKCNEAPNNGTYRGMGSTEAMIEAGHKRYGSDKIDPKIPQGVVGTIEKSGESVEQLNQKLISALKQSLQYVGIKNLSDLKPHKVFAERRSLASRIEGSAHSLDNFTI